MFNQTTINVQVASQIKEEATNILEELGLDINTAINIFLIQVVKRNCLPFEVSNTKPNKDMIEALKEVEEMIDTSKKYHYHASIILRVMLLII